VEGVTFHWATGIEDTFITAPWPATGRILDEYELTGHYPRWSEDIDRIASLGVKVARYGIPWYRVNPAPGRWDWAWADDALGRLLERGVAPIVDLVHYGLPEWIEGAWLNPDLPARIAEYASRLAERWRGRIRAYTPLNEPRITAWYCGRIGWWPPNRRGWKGFVAVMEAVCRSIQATCRALREVDPETLLVHVDATDHYSSGDPALRDEVAFRQDVGFLALDLASGRVEAGHPLRDWLIRRGARHLEELQAGAVPLDVVGLNMYPMFSRKVLSRTRPGLRFRMPYGDGRLVEDLVELYWARYRRPMMITETAASGSVAKRLAWLETSLAAVRALRARGVPLIGYTWWPMFALVAWAWRQSEAPVARHLQQMGLWDLDPALERVETPLVAAWREQMARGMEGPDVRELLPGRL
jgi:hypothetical protein